MLLLLPLLCTGEGHHGDSQLHGFTHNPAIWAYSQDPTYWLYNQDQAILGYSHDLADMGYSQNWPILGYRSQTPQELSYYPPTNIHHLSARYPEHLPSDPTGYQLPVVSEREVVLPPLHPPHPPAPAPLHPPLPPAPAPLLHPVLHNTGEVGGIRVRGASEQRDQHPVIGRVHQLPPPVTLPNLAPAIQQATNTGPALARSSFQPAVPRTAAGSVPRPAVHHLPAVPSRASPGDSASASWCLATADVVFKQVEGWLPIHNQKLLCLYQANLGLRVPHNTMHR